MKILVPTAGTMPAKKNANYIVDVASKLGAKIVVLHILEEEEQAGKGEEAVRIFSEAGRNAKVNIATMLTKGDIVAAIVEFAEKESADLIIMGASPDKVIAEWTSSAVMSETTIPVVVIPHAFQRTVAS